MYLTLIDRVALLSTVNRKQSSLDDFFSVENYTAMCVFHFNIFDTSQ